jgi:hypothetical protein
MKRLDRNRTAYLAIALLWAIMGPGGFSPALAAGEDAIPLLDEILATGPRFIGQPGHGKTADIIQRRLETLPGIVVVKDEEINYEPDEPRLIVHEMDQVVPVVEEANLRFDDGREARIYPCWPNGARLPTTPRDGLEGELVYVGLGLEKDIPAKRLRGAIVAMEYNTFDRWTELAQFGPRAILFLAPKDTTWEHSHGKFADLTFHLPRFYVEDDETADRLRSPRAGESIRIVSRMKWAAKTVRNLVVILPGQDTKLRSKVVVANARYDACSVVPELAYGAEQAISAAVLWETVKRIASVPRKRTFVAMWTGADSMNFAGLRSILHAARRAHGTELYHYSKDREVNEERDKLQSSLEAFDRQEKNIHEGLFTALSSDSDVLKRYELAVKRHLIPIEKKIKSLNRESRESSDIEALRDRIKELKAQRKSYDKLTIAVQRNRVDPEEVPGFAEFTGVVLEQIRAERDEARVALPRLLKEIAHLRPFLDRNTVSAFLAPDISSQGPRFGLYWMSQWRNDNNFHTLSSLSQRLIGRRGIRELPDEVYDGFLDDTMLGLRDWESDICCPLATAADPAEHYAYVALAMVTADDGRWVVDSPLDRGDRLNRDNIVRQIPAIAAITERSLNIYKLRHRFVHRYTRVHRIDGQAVTAAPGDVRLDLGLPGRLALVTAYRPVPRGVGTRWTYATITSATGHYRIPYVSRSFAAAADYWADVVGFDDDGKIVEAANHSDAPQAYKFKNIISLGHGTAHDAKSIMFKCRPQYLAGLRDPRYLHNLQFLRPMDQRTGDNARFHAERAAGGLGALFLDEKREWILAASRGERGVRMIMTNADEESPKGRGFGYGTEIRSVIRSTLEDFQHLNDSRLQNLVDSGVVGKMAHELRDRSSRSLASMKDAFERDDAGEAMYHARSAYGIHQVLYNHLLAMGHDTVMSVVFLLLVLLPFSFYAERLVVNSATIYGRIVGFVVVFLVMMGLLISFHPAFRLALTPVIVLLAFIIIVLSAVVSVILYLRFADQLKGSMSQEHDASLSRLDVVSQAMLVGISNMRRRKIRTAFTLVTLAVMTFALLSLSGTRTELSEKRYRINIPPVYPGVLITHVGWRKLPPVFLEELDASYGDEASVGGQYWVVANEHRWMRSFKPYFLLRRNDGSDDRVLFNALLGVGVNETKFLTLDDQTKTLFDRVARRPDACLLPSSAAERLGISVGDDVRIHGRVFEVIGILDEEKLASQRYLNGLPYGPIDLTSERMIAQGGGGWYFKEIAFTEGMLDANLVSADLSISPLPPSEFAVIQDDAARAMGATLRSVCIRADNPELLDRISADLSTQRLMPIFRSSGNDDVHLVATRTKLGIVGVRDLFIPLLIGALIVMNTMINAVADQKSTIHIYTSLGLAPVHVGMLFLSEAAALGTLGVVGGFILGQGFGTIAEAAGWFGAITLNYSSTAVIFTMFLVMVIVLLSAIYPAMMAGRLAAPAESRRWELPAPEGDQVSMELPFTVSETTARGAPAFLRQWISLHSESGVGIFISDECRVLQDSGQERRILDARLWLAPFDAGVSQNLRLEFHPAEEGGSAHHSKFYEVSARMIRRSGQQINWLRSNRAFVAELRKQFLLWRTLSPERQGDYVRESEELVGQA